MDTSFKNKEIIFNENFLKRRFFSWSAIIVGTLVGLGVSFLLNLFGLSIGLTAFRTVTNTTTFAVGGFLALLIISIVSMATLGYVSGYLGALKKLSCNQEKIHCNHGCLYGFTAWSLALVLTIILSSQVGKFISVTTNSIVNPGYVLQNTSPERSQVTSQVQPNPISNITADTTKQLALATFISFVLFFIGAFSATLAGYIGYERSLRRHGIKIE